MQNVTSQGQRPDPWAKDLGISWPLPPFTLAGLAGLFPSLQAEEGGVGESCIRGWGFGSHCCPQINFSPTLWIIGWRTGTLKVACWARCLYQMQKQNPLCYQEVTFLNSISLMITYCFPESAPKLFKRNSLSPWALRFASSAPIPEMCPWSHSLGFGREIDNKGFFVCLFVWKGCLYICVKRKWWGLFPKVKL